MYAGTPFERVPTVLGVRNEGLYGRNVAGIRSFGGGSGMQGMQLMKELGVMPQLIRGTGPGRFGRTFYINEEGQRMWIPGGNNPDTLRKMGFSPEQVVLVGPGAIRQFPPGGIMGAEAAKRIPVPEPGGYGALGTPLIEPASGALLSSPHLMAGERWNAMTLPQKRIMLGAWEAAGMGSDVSKDILQTFTPTGRYGPRRIGFMGGQM
jgi:hypothetical protein